MFGQQPEQRQFIWYPALGIQSVDLGSCCVSEFIYGQALLCPEVLLWWTWCSKSQNQLKT